MRRACFRDTVGCSTRSAASRLRPRSYSPGWVTSRFKPGPVSRTPAIGPDAIAAGPAGVAGARGGGGGGAGGGLPGGRFLRLVRLLPPGLVLGLPFLEPPTQLGQLAALLVRPVEARFPLGREARLGRPGRPRDARRGMPARSR